MSISQNNLFGSVEQTTSSIQSYLKGSEANRSSNMKILPRIRCADGFSMSVQASDFHCCTPKTLDGPYSHVEVGYPSEPQEKLLPYRIAEEDIDLEHSIFGHVPVAVLVEIINDHGGLSL